MRPNLQALSAMALTMTAEQERASIAGAGDRAAGELAGRDVLGSDGLRSTDVETYRVLSAAAVISCGLAICSIVALVDVWQLKILPLVGAAVGLFSLVRIARAPDELSGRKLALLGTAGNAFFLATGFGLSLWTYATEVPPDAVRISYQQLKPTADRPHAAPPAAAELDGKRVFIKGYMFPTAHDRGITRFVLCRDNGDCCFGGQPPQSDMILIQLQEPLDTAFTTSIRRVAGTFRVAGQRSADVNQEVLYQLDADYIR